MKQITLYILFLCLTFFACREELPSDPIIEMVSVKALSGTDYFVRAMIVNDGNTPVSAYGFIVSKNFVVSVGYSYGLDFKAGTELEADSFSLLISIDRYQEDSILYFQSYLVNKYGKMYSKPIRVDLNRIVPLGIIPSMAEQGDTITITGSGFDPEPEKNLILFGETTAQIVTADSTRLTVKVPSNLHHVPSGLTVSVIKKEQRYVIGNFRVIPRILSVSPTTGTFNTQIQINFDNLASSYNDYYVDFGNTYSWSKRSTGNNIIVVVPKNIKSKHLEIRVYNDYVECKTLMKFTIKPMVITSLSRTEGPVNTVFLIYGTGFNPNSDGNAVKIGNKFAYLKDSGNGVLVPVVPSGLSPGIYDIQIFNSIDTLVMKNGFKVTP